MGLMKNADFKDLPELPTGDGPENIEVLKVIIPFEKMFENINAPKLFIESLCKVLRELYSKPLCELLNKIFKKNFKDTRTYFNQLLFAYTSFNEMISEEDDRASIIVRHCAFFSDLINTLGPFIFYFDKKTQPDIQQEMNSKLDIILETVRNHDIETSVDRNHKSVLIKNCEKICAERPELLSKLTNGKFRILKSLNDFMYEYSRHGDISHMNPKILSSFFVKKGNKKYKDSVLNNAQYDYNKWLIKKGLVENQNN
jgi:hypothetical protein